jgi:hypothetical protein
VQLCEVSLCPLTEGQLPSQCVWLPRRSRCARKCGLPRRKNGVCSLEEQLFCISNDSSVEWARDNIGAFGGDPENMIIWGQSAGRWRRPRLKPATNQSIHRRGPGRVIHLCQRRRTHRQRRNSDVRSRQQPGTR